MRNKTINLRSDTCTLPTEEMREAMKNTPVGDDVYGEDPTINELERLAAHKMGKKAALFVASGTMGNLIALMAHCQRGEEVVLEADSHIYYYEVGGIGAIAGLTPRLVKGQHGIMDPVDIKAVLRKENIHYPNTRLICLESSHNRGGGTVVPLDVMRETYDLARDHSLKIHLDGARIFNAALYLNTNPENITKYVDSVMFCLSKGLSAPVGSMLCGDVDFIQRARKIRKMLGGGMRQAGVLAAAGIVALRKMVERLSEDHDNARRLAEQVADIPGINIDLETVQTNMVLMDVSKLGVSSEEFSQELAKYGILCSTRPPYQVRMVTNRHISSADIDTVTEAITVLAKNKNILK